MAYNRLFSIIRLVDQKVELLNKLQEENLFEDNAEKWIKRQRRIAVISYELTAISLTMQCVRGEVEKILPHLEELKALLRNAYDVQDLTDFPVGQALGLLRGIETGLTHSLSLDKEESK